MRKRRRRRKRREVVVMWDVEGDGREPKPKVPKWRSPKNNKNVSTFVLSLTELEWGIGHSLPHVKGILSTVYKCSSVVDMFLACSHGSL